MDVYARRLVDLGSLGQSPFGRSPVAVSNSLFVAVSISALSSTHRQHRCIAVDHLAEEKDRNGWKCEFSPSDS